LPALPLRNAWKISLTHVREFILMLQNLVGNSRS
jgi:hypothetical protein